MAYKFNEPTDKPKGEYTLLPDGDYIAEVVGVDINDATGQRGVKFAIDGKPNKVFDNLREQENMFWKTDRFVRCMDMKLTPNADGACPFETHFTEAAMIGLRGPVRIKTEEHNGKKSNKIAIYYIDRPKLPRRVDLPTNAEMGKDPFA